jgi:hypothetical protein
MGRSRAHGEDANRAFVLNQWHDVVIELKKGAILLPIDFKAVDFGTCQIDSIRLWEGL